MKLITAIFSVVLFFLVLPALFNNNVSAQVCLGSQTCCPAGALKDVCSGPPGCTRGQPGCSCVEDCVGGDVTQACSGASCTTNFPGGCDYLYGSCSWSSPPPPPPPPTGGPPSGGGSYGACGSCECGHPGECETDPDGNCVWDPGRCAGGGGGGGPVILCQVQAPTSVTVRVGETISFVTTVRAVFLEVRSVGWTLLDQSLSIARFPLLGFRRFGYNIGQNTCCNFKQSTQNFNQLITGVSPGTIWMRIIAQGGGDDPDYCSRDATVTVTNDPLPPGFPTVDVKVDGTDGPGVYVPGVPFDVSWTSTDTTACTAYSYGSYQPPLATAWWGARATSGSQQVVAQPAFLAYKNDLLSLTCTGPGGRASDAVRITTTPIAPAATITLTPDPLNIAAGQTGTMVANINVTPPGSAADIREVRFSSGDSSVCTAFSPDITGPNYTSTITGAGAGSTTVTGTVELFSGETFDGEAEVNVTAPGPWWQVTGGEVISGSNLISRIPQSCALSPSCTDSLILNDPISNRPATAIYNDNYDFSSTATRGTVSATNQWLVRAGTRPNIYSYAFFNNLASGKNFTTLPNNATVRTPDIASAPLDAGYSWIRATGNVSLGEPGGSPQVLVNKKAILFVDGDLTIYDEVRIGNTASDFFMVVVSGDIDVDPSLVSPDTTTPAIQGIYTCDGTFSTGTNGVDDGILVVEGSVAASAFNLERDLVNENTDTPAEHFIYSPALISNYPSALAERHLIWREVAP